MTQEEIMEEIAKKYNLKVKEVEKIYLFQFKFVAMKMKEPLKHPKMGTRLPYFGVFAKQPKLFYRKGGVCWSLPTQDIIQEPTKKDSEK